MTSINNFVYDGMCFSQFVMESTIFLLFLLLTLTYGRQRQEDLSCPRKNSQGIYSIVVPADSPEGPVNLMHIQYDSIRKAPITSSAFFDKLNHQKNEQRKDNFRPYECQTVQHEQTECEHSYKMTAEQQEFSGTKKSYDRGHLVPVNPNHFSASAVNNTFYCINMGVQDPYTNQHPWQQVEGAVLNFFGEDVNGYVITGLCDEDNSFSPTAQGYRIPDCYWKMACYVDEEGETVVVSFIGNNTLLSNDDKQGMQRRMKETKTPRSQQDVLDVMHKDSSLVLEAWAGAEKYLLENREAKGAPRAKNCQRAWYISKKTKEEWAQKMGIK